MDSISRFSGRQEDYAAARPSYPQAFLDELLRQYNDPGACTVADVGAGTGKLSAQLLECGFRVYGVEPNPDMRATAESLLGSNPRFFSIAGCHKDVGLPPRCVDFITVAQAFHWFDPAAFRQECLRILKEPGYVFLIWNSRDLGAPQNAAVYRLFQRFCPQFRGFSGGFQEDDGNIRSFYVHQYDKLVFPHRLTFTQEAFLRRTYSSSYSLQPGDREFPAYRAALLQVFEAFAKDGLMEVPNETVVYAGLLRE